MFLESLSSLLQACNALLHLLQLILSVAAQPLHNLIQKVDNGLQHLHPCLRLPHTFILLLQRPPQLCVISQAEVL